MVEEAHIPFGQIKEVTGITDRDTITNTWKNCASRRGTVEEITNEVIATLLGPTPSVCTPHSQQVCFGDRQETGPTALCEAGPALCEAAPGLCEADPVLCETGPILCEAGRAQCEAGLVLCINDPVLCKAGSATCVAYFL